MEYRYTECGLDNVVIDGIQVVTDHAGEHVYSIPKINKLHRAIAHAIITHEHGMSGKELRFLRTEMGYTQEQLADLLHVERLTVSRWERGECALNGTTEFTVRSIAAEKLDINPEMSREELVRRCVWRAEIQPIRIDGSNPENYRPIAA